eukprot:Pgem_evm1s8567
MATTRGSKEFKSGWLQKKGGQGVLANMRTRWVVLTTDKILTYYANPEDTKPKGVVDLNNYNFCTMESSNPKMFSISNTTKEGSNVRKFIMVADTQQTMMVLTYVNDS